MKKAAFITGAGGYIGGEVAYNLAMSGINVAVNDIDDERVNKTVERILKDGGNAIGIPADVTDSASITEAIELAAEKFGRLDIMVHVAGGSARIAGPNYKYAPLINQDDYVIDCVLKVNLYGAFWASRAAARIMVKQNEGGRIINFASAVGICGLVGSSDYAAAKGGVMSMTKALAKELGPHKITVNAVAPGVVARPDTNASEDYMYNTNFLHEKCLASDVADLVAFLASDKARMITGQTYVIDGGRTLSMKGTD